MEKKETRQGKEAAERTLEVDASRESRRRIQSEAGRCRQSQGCEGHGFIAPSQERGRKDESGAERGHSDFAAPHQL